MKNKLKKLLAVALSAAFILTAVPLSGFAAVSGLYIDDGKLYDGTNAQFTSALSAGDKIDGSKAAGAFYAVINGSKDLTAANYGEKSFVGKTENSEASASSENTYFTSYTVPAAPEGYKEPVTPSVEKASDFYWNSDESAAYSGNVLKLEFTPIQYQVEFDLNGGKLAEGLTLSTSAVNYNESFNLPTASEVKKDGFVLTGWSDGEKTYPIENTVKNLSSKDGEKITLVAVWSESEKDDSNTDTFTVTYYSENEQYGSVQTYKSGEAITLPTPPQKDGYVFEGWVIDNDQTKLPEKMPAENIKAYASWALASISVKYIVDEVETSATTALYGSDIALTVPTDPKKDGYTFEGWFDADGNNVYSYKTVPSKDLVFSARWLKDGNVTYYVDGKTYESYSVTEGEAIPVPSDPEKFGKIFAGWDPEVPEKMPAEDLSFNATWETDKEFVSVVVGGTLIAGGVVAAIAGAGAAAITGISIIGGIIALIGGISLVNGKTYTATYKVDGEVYKTYSVKAGNAIPVPSDPEKDGFVFAGWNPEIPEKMPKSDITFTATWKEAETEKVEDNISVEVPSTGSTAAGIAAFFALSVSAAAIILLAKKKKNK